jgi:tRNA threonylcarbamoyladenosine biosynthesis protein TsaB
MNVLVFDTSNHILGVAVMKEDQVIGKLTTSLEKNQSARLMPAIEALIKETEIQADTLDRVVVAQGPGSYTGVRIGLTTAKTMAWALDIPVVGVSSLEALAYQGRFFEGLICPFFDARRGRVYAGLYRWDRGRLVSVGEDKNADFTEVLNELKAGEERVLFLSPDMDQFDIQVKGLLGSLAVIPPGPYHQTDPAHLGLAGLDKEPAVTHEITPNYLRMAEAEVKWLEQQKDREKNG